LIEDHGVLVVAQASEHPTLYVRVRWPSGYLGYLGLIGDLSLSFNPRWRGNFRAISYPYTHEGLGVVVRVVEEGGIGRPSERDAARSACPGLPTRHPITYVDRLLVSGGPGALEETLREMVRRQKPYLLAAACVRLPPVQWLEIMVARCRSGHAPLPALAANLAGLLGKDPVEYGPRLEAIIEEALKWG
jgi:hypothetical protein